MNNTIDKIIRSYNYKFIETKELSFNNKEIVHLKNVYDIIKISYELDKNIMYIKKKNKYLLFIDNDNYFMVCEVDENENIN